MQEANLAIKPDKLQLAKSRYEYLLFESCKGERNCTKEGREMAKQLRRPKSKKEIQRLLGYINYFRYFLPDMSRITKPITNNLKKEEKFRWTEDCKQAFMKLANRLAEEQRLLFIC